MFYLEISKKIEASEMYKLIRKLDLLQVSWWTSLQLYFASCAVVFFFFNIVILSSITIQKIKKQIQTEKKNEGQQRKK